MRQHEAVIKVMQDNGGYATLGHLYQHVLKVPGCEWKTKTPFASIRRIVQDSRFFFKIKPGLWALNSERESVLNKLSIGDNSSGAEQEQFNHTYFQGMLVDIGNMKGFETFVPPQDKNRRYLSRPLSEYASLDRYLEFTYERVLKRAMTIDVTWFNRRGFPHSLFEVEHSTNMDSSLLKFMELRDFNTGFCIVADAVRQREFNHKMESETFGPIRERVRFLDYERLASYYSRLSALSVLEQRGGLVWQ